MNKQNRDNDIIEVSTPSQKGEQNKLALIVFLIFAAIGGGLGGGGIAGGNVILILIGIGVISVGAVLMSVLQKRGK